MAEIYLDNSATTAVSPAVAEYMLKIMTEQYGNPSSLHRMGFTAERNLEAARGQIAAVLGVDSAEIVFTSGGTEANNIAVIGAARAAARRGRRVITTAIEHPSLLNSAKSLVSEGFEVVIIPPEPDGSISPQRVADAVNADTILVSVMYVNSETGAVNDLRAISAAVRRINPGALMHSDCVQGFCRLPVYPRSMGLDMISASAHKIHGPKGAGFVYIAKGTRVLPVLRGSGQEHGIRPGTENMPGWCGMGLAAQEMWSRRARNDEHYSELRAHLEDNIRTTNGLCINSPSDGAPYIYNFSAMGVRSETMIHFLEQYDISVSGGSACSKGARSHVLAAMGLPNDRIDSAIRVSLCDLNTIQELDIFCRYLREGLSALVRARR